MPVKKGILDRLKEGVVVGDGGFVFALEKRGYVKAGPWTPEATVEHPEAVRQLHREFLRAGSDVMQAFTFYASDDKLENRGHYAQKSLTGKKINEEACRLAREVANEGNALVAGGICQTPTYLSGGDKETCKDILRGQCDVFADQQVDFIICEYFEHVEEMELAIEVAKETKLPVAANMCIGPDGDMHGVSTGDCAVRMAKAGADIVGLNCHFSPFDLLEGMKKMKEALDAADLHPYLMVQPLAFHTPDANRQGFIDLPEFPFALEPRILTRWEIQTFARQAYDMGVRYIGGCCGFEPYHIRAVSEELVKERNVVCEGSTKEQNVACEGSTKHDMWGGGLRMHTKPWVRARARKDYWENIKPSSGRPFSSSLSKPDNWGVTAGHELLKQHKEETSKQELADALIVKAGFPIS